MAPGGPWRMGEALTRALRPSCGARNRSPGACPFPACRWRWSRVPPLPGAGVEVGRADLHEYEVSALAVATQQTFGAFQQVRAAGSGYLILCWPGLVSNEPGRGSTPGSPDCASGVRPLALIPNRARHDQQS